MNKAFEKIIDELKQESIIVDDDAGHRAVEIIHQIAEEYNNGWIPCSEKLPEPNQKVIVTYMDRYIGGRYGVCEGQYVYSLNSWDISDYMSDDDFEVLAWQPLPEPYQEKGK